MLKVSNTSNAFNNETIVHGTCVTLNGRGVLILGRSASGKSSLALQLMAFGLQLVSDDKTLLKKTSSGIVAQCPPNISGLIEARGIGILLADCADETRLELVVDMDHIEKERYPHRREVKVLDRDLPCLHKIEAAYFPAAILQYLRGGLKDNA